MAKARGNVRISKGVPFGGNGRTVTRKVVSRIGQPGEALTRFTFPVIPKPVFRKARIRMLQKVDVSKGITMPEASNMTSASGVVTGGRGGYKGGVRLLHLFPRVPPKGGRNQRVVKAPSPTSGAGVRSPYNARSRVGRRGSNKRFGG